MAEELLRSASSPATIGAVVPHAGWVFSGSTAALGISAIAAAQPETVVIFGAVHGPDRNAASVYARGSWDTPLGGLLIDAELAHSFTGLPWIVDAPAAHRHEHSIEVQLALLKCALPDVRIVPVNVRPGPDAAEVGRFCAERVRSSGKRVGFLGSTDLTHYGPAFAFEPHGRGNPGIRWAKEVNDRRFIALLERLDAEELVHESAIHRNACGPGAVAALVAAMRELGMTRYQELRHTSSAECEVTEGHDPYNSVGYEAGVFLPAT
jgi:AmmeMemoRadiSam system protein B